MMRNAPSSRRRTSEYRLIITVGVLLTLSILHLFVSPISQSLKSFSELAHPKTFDFLVSLENDTNQEPASQQQQPQHETLALLREKNLTSQYLPQRNVSRNLCGAIPQASPKATRFPQILATNHGPQCRPNAILYVVQKGKHASYGRDSTALFFKSLDSLYQNYLSLNGHSDSVDLLVFHSGEYNEDDLLLLDQRYNQTVHFKLINLNATDYWTLPETVRDDNTRLWRHANLFSVGYRHMIRWYGLKLYDFARDYGTEAGGCEYKYLMRMDEDSFLLSPVQYDLFDFMQHNNYSYAFRMCSFEMETGLWEDYLDHVRHCGLSLPDSIPRRAIQEELCGFYNNFFIMETSIMLQPDVQYFVQWIDDLGNMYRDRYNDLRIQTILVYAFVPPERIHRFLDWSYEHMTTSKGCPIFGALQAGYLDPNWDVHFDRLTAEYVVDQKRCRFRRKNLHEKGLSPTYSHLPPSSWFVEKFGIPREKFGWRTFAEGVVEVRNKGIMSG